MGETPSPAQIAEEDRRLRYLRVVVDLTSNVIRQGGLNPREAQRLVDAARRHILNLFPGKEETYDLIYRPRFERLIREFAREGRPDP